MNILKSLAILIGVLSLATFSTHSFFTSQASVVGNEFSAGVWATPTPAPIPSISPTPLLTPTPFQQIAICHATGAEKNPYVEITISEQGVLNGHLPHHDDIIPAPAGGCPTEVVGGASIELTPTPSPTPTPTPTPTPSESPSPTETPSPVLTK